ncbi:MAG: homoserine kinase [Sporichthyaceae bacterium]|nr:homoserine kinase [Sporichthyaceae bacterium]
MLPSAVVVTVPATSANLGPGFDALGLALSLVDEVRVETATGGTAPDLTIEVSGEGADEVPLDESHLVVRALLATCAHVGAARPRLVLRCTNRIPHGRGLGSSAAATLAGVLAARALLAPDLADAEVLALASEIEGHPDNAAACLLGGLTIAWSEAAGVRATRLEPVRGLRATLLVPGAGLSTQSARGMLPAMVPHNDAAHSAGRAALLVHALTTRPDLLLAATEDRLHQQYRAQAAPDTAALVAHLRDRGVPAVVSGAGPSVLALTTGAPVELPTSASDWSVLDLDVAAVGATVSAVS